MFAALYFMLWLGLFETTSQPFDPCEVYGTIYVTNNEWEADVRVYEEASEAFADVLVFEETNQLYADKRGKWYFTDSRDLADVVIYWVDERRDGDLSVYFTNFESFAGCNR